MSGHLLPEADAHIRSAEDGIAAHQRTSFESAWSSILNANPQGFLGVPKAGEDLWYPSHRAGPSSSAADHHPPSTTPPDPPQHHQGGAGEGSRPWEERGGGEECQGQSEWMSSSGDEEQVVEPIVFIRRGRRRGPSCARMSRPRGFGGRGRSVHHEEDVDKRDEKDEKKGCGRMEGRGGMVAPQLQTSVQSRGSAQPDSSTQAPSPPENHTKGSGPHRGGPDVRAEEQKKEEEEDEKDEEKDADVAAAAYQQALELMETQGTPGQDTRVSPSDWARALELLQVALRRCPPGKRAALVKIQRGIRTCQAALPLHHHHPDAPQAPSSSEPSFTNIRTHTHTPTHSHTRSQSHTRRYAPTHHTSAHALPTRPSSAPHAAPGEPLGSNPSTSTEASTSSASAVTDALQGLAAASLNKPQEDSTCQLTRDQLQEGRCSTPLNPHHHQNHCAHSGVLTSHTPQGHSGEGAADALGQTVSPNSDPAHLSYNFRRSDPYLRSQTAVEYSFTQHPARASSQSNIEVLSPHQPGVSEVLQNNQRFPRKSADSRQDVLERSDSDLSGASDPTGVYTSRSAGGDHSDSAACEARADEAFRQALDNIDNGNQAEALRLLKVAAAECPAHRRNAKKKIAKLIHKLECNLT